MAYYNTNQYKEICRKYISKVIKSIQCKLYNKMGHEGEKCVCTIFRNYGYDMVLNDNPNQPIYDALIYGKNKELTHIVQIKTDSNGDLKCPRISNEKLLQLCLLAKANNCKPILMEYYPYHNNIVLICYFNDNVYQIVVNNELYDIPE